MAAIKWVQNADANGNELQNARMHNVNGDPGAPGAGQIWYDTATGKLKYRDGVSTTTVDLRNRGTHTGTQTAATISDFDTQVRTSRLDQMAAPTAAVAFNSQRITGLADPSGAQDAATKNYVDGALTTATAGLTWKSPVRAATTGNITISNPGTATFDGITLSNGDRLLVKNQSTASQNGVYQFNGSGSALTRTTDADSSAELQGGVIVAVDEGTANGNTAWMLSVDVATVGTDAVTWVQFGAGSAYTASLGVQLVGSDFRANLGTGLTLSGNSIIPDFGTGTNKVARAKFATGFVGTSGADVTITHSFGLADKSDFLVAVYENTGGAKVDCGVVANDTNSIILSFATTPTSNQYRYSIWGLS